MMTATEVVAELESVFGPLFESARNDLALEYPSVEVRKWSSSIGRLTEYDGYDIGIECVFSDARPEESNCVSASVGVWHLSTTPEFNSFGVDWCSGASPTSSAELLSSPIPFEKASTTELAARVPELLSHLRTAVTKWITRDPTPNSAVAADTGHSLID
jgi:hypothetical protein